MNNLTLEIEDGHKYDNLINEIENDYYKYDERARYYYKKKDYEKTLKYYELCIKLDPDNTNHIRIHSNLKFLVNELLKKYIDCSYHSFYNKKYNISHYYISKSLSLYILFQDKISKQLKQFEEILKKRLYYINSLYTYKDHTIHKNDLYSIKI